MAAGPLLSDALSKDFVLELDACTFPQCYTFSYLLDLSEGRPASTWGTASTKVKSTCPSSPRPLLLPGSLSGITVY